MSSPALALRQAFMAVGQPRDAHGKWTKGGMQFEPRAGGNEEIEASLKTVYADWAGGLNEVEAFAVENYMGSSSVYNMPLRNNQAPFAGTGDLDSALAKSSSPEMTVYRGLKEADFEPGDVFVDRGFVSTSANMHTAGSFAGRKMAVDTETEEIVSSYVVAKIHVPAGSKAAAVNAVSDSRHEAEVVLARSGVYQVTSVKQERVLVPRLDDIMQQGPFVLNATVYEIELVHQP